jgi:hypothetical protein
LAKVDASTIVGVGCATVAENLVEVRVDVSKNAKDGIDVKD